MVEGKLTVSTESLTHFKCPYCKGWWSIGDAPKREHWFCPWCGKVLGSPDEYRPEHESGEGQWYIENTIRRNFTAKGIELLKRVWWRSRNRGGPFIVGLDAEESLPRR